MNKKRQFVYLTSLIALASLVWLVSTLNEVDEQNNLAPQAEKQVSDSVVVISSTVEPQGEETSSAAFELMGSNEALDRVNEELSGVNNTEPSVCSSKCDSTLSMLDQNIEIEDGIFQRLGAYTQEIADYLQSNQDKRQYFTKMALATTDGDKRAYLTEIFKLLPEQQRIEIADNFIVSENWRVRADGVFLFADNGVTNLDMASSLTDILIVDENPYVKGKILTQLANSPTLRGDAQVLRRLDLAIYYDTNTSVQIAALKAKMQLSEKSYQILPDALQALRSSDPEFQLAGLVTIEKVLLDETDLFDANAYVDINSLKNEFEIIKNLTVYGEDRARFDRLVKEADAIYSRYF